MAGRVMHSSFPLLLLCFVAATSAVSDLERLLLKERWLPSSIPNLNNVSAQCQKDVETWLDGLESLATDFYHCFLDPYTNCTEKTQNDIKKNIYALKQLDAFGRIPPGVLDIDLTQAGSETECKEVSTHYVYRTHYCYVYSVLGQNSTCDASTTQSPLALKTAVCMPSSCSPEDIPIIMESVGGNGLIKTCAAQCVPEKPHTNVFFWIFVGFLGTLLGVCILASGVDFVRETYLGRPSATAESGLKLLLAFSFYTNGHSILDTSPAKEGHLKSLDCIRFLSMLWVVTGHVAMLFLENDILLPILTIFKPIGVDTIADAVFSVDTFFTLSGMLVSYMFFKQMSKNRKLVKNPLTWVLFYVHRYLRLTPPYMLFICFYIAFVPLMVGQNALLMNNQQSVDICVKYWWRNLIYINNFVPKDGCYAITWYLAADTQMYVVAPVFLVALFISHWLGLVVILGAISGSVGLNFYYTYHYNLAASIVRSGTTGMDFFNKLYVTPWIRITPYLVGIYVGYLLAFYPKSKRPNVHFIVPLIGWVFFLSVGLAIVYGPHDYIAFETDWSKFVCALYYSLSRVGWAMFICWVVVANHYGWGGPIAAFMDLPIWQPLGRLSYTAYLVHFFLIMYFMNLSDRPLHFTTLWGQFQMYTVPITVLAYVFAFLWSCLCELPFLKLEKMAVDGLIRSRRQEVKPIEKKLEESWTVEEKELNEKF